MNSSIYDSSWNWIRKHKWRLLLIAMAALLVISPISEVYDQQDNEITPLTAVVFLAVIFGTAEMKRTVQVLTIFTLIWLIISLGTEGSGLFAGLSLMAPFLFMVLLVTIFTLLVRWMIRVTHIDTEVICGAICGYLLLGILWTGFYAIGSPPGRLSGKSVDAHQQVCEFWPSDFTKLFREAGLPRQAPPALAESSSSMPNRGGALGPRIVSPRSDRVYQVRIGSGDGEVVDLLARSETARDRVYWFVDFAYLGVSPVNTPMLWKAVAGHHTIRAVDETGRADARAIDIVGVQ